MPNLRLEGLMTMAPLTMDKEVVRTAFARAGNCSRKSSPKKSPAHVSIT